ncbi:hypothetical protein [Streptomyces coelicoflavus]|uniref:hypothetical protein n=1 Tax=Streptomyces coelicoflavus TaxID=285562 RepID=UPI003F4A1E0C
MHGVPGHRPTGRPGGREAALPGPRSEPGGRYARAVRPAARGAGSTVVHRPDRGHRTAAALVAAGSGAGSGRAGSVLPAGSRPVPARPPDTDDPAARHSDRADPADRADRADRGVHGRWSPVDRSRR